MSLINVFGLYYLFCFVLIGIGGSLVLTSDFDELFENKLKLIFMYQYALYKITEDKLNLVGIIILEILLTLSVWFLNVLIFVILCIWYVISAIWNLFYFIFKKR